MNLAGVLLKETVSPDPRAPSLVVFDRTAGRMDEASRRRIRDELARNHPGVLTSEPGQQYRYSDENIVADIRVKLEAQRRHEARQWPCRSCLE